LGTWAYLALKLLAVLANPDSQMHLMSSHFFNKGTPEEWLMFQKNLAKVLIGQDITTGTPTYGMTRHLLKGVALRKFDKSALAHDT
jgi:hypothetical protein